MPSTSGKAFTPAKSSSGALSTIVSPPKSPTRCHKKDFRQGRIPPHIKSWIKDNAGLVLGYLEALEDTQGGAQGTTFSTSQLAEVEDPQAFRSILADDKISAKQNHDINQDHIVPQDSASNVSGRFSQEPVAASANAPFRKRKYTDADLAAEEDQLANDNQAYTHQEDHITPDHTGTTTTAVPKPFITPNLPLARSIDHSKTNPSNTIRLRTPYPAPHDILIASHKKYKSNIAAANAKAQLGATDTSNRIPFTIYEDDQIIAHMLAVSQDSSVPQTEERFAEVSRRLCGDGSGVYRSGTAIKNMWCRVGRGRSGYDERKGVRRRGDHVVNGWRAKPGNEKRKSGGGGKRVKVDHAAAIAGEGANDAWFEL